MMNDHFTFKSYYLCIKDLIVKTLEDKKIRWQFCGGVVLLAFGIFSTVAVPLVLKACVDAFSDTSVSVVTLTLISYGLLWMLSQATTHMRAMITYQIEQRITVTLGIKVLAHLYTLSQRFFLNQKPGAITNVIRRAQQDVPMITLGIFFHLLPTFLEFVCVLCLIGYLYPLSYSSLLGGVLIAFILFTFCTAKNILKVRETANKVDMETDGILTDWLLNHEFIKTFGQTKLALETCERELRKREKAEVTFMNKFSYIRLGQSLILGLGLTLITYVVGEGVRNNTLSVGDFVLFNGYILQFIIPVSVLGQVTQDIKKALVDLKGILKILLTESEVRESTSSSNLQGSEFSLQFKDVSFTYNNRRIIKNLSFTIEAGETALIVGPTGIGKSTLAKLMLRLYDPHQGQILINDTQLSEITFSSLYETIGWVPQDSTLFNDTILNNLLFVRPTASQKDIEKALDHACLLPFIQKLPEGLDTFVGDRGLKLSGGEKQRLSLARLFLKSPKICIFDEATSFLDRSTELVIQKNIETYLPTMTKIIITHRPFMVDKADIVIRLDEQGIAETQPLLASL